MNPNHLAGEKSPYLLQHRDNPVDWYPWGAEAFARARAEDKPVFLSIGYSTCHWCHVMAHESFENAETAALMNEKFINIKVDREERPDVDRVYMAFVQATTGGGGWPMSVWLTPEGRPFFGGTYFPPADAFGRAGFPAVLAQIARLWASARERVEAEAARLLEVLQESGDPGSGVSKDWIEAAHTAFGRIYDAERGGFGGAPKFPRPSVLNFLLRGGEDARAMALHTLRAMSRGGLRDQLGGGFHRYSVDGRWHVPHFEKMLYDQAQIAISLVEAWQITDEEFFRETALTTLAYVARDLAHPEGGLFSAEDADSLVAHGRAEHAEGAFYVWTRDEIAALLGDADAAIFCSHYGVEAGGNAPEGSDPHREFAGKNILIELRSAAETAALLGLSTEDVVRSLAASREILLRHRAGRPRPHLDDKILTAWNGLMISAFARAGAAFGEPGLLDSARRAAEFVLSRLTSDGDLLRSWRGEASGIRGFAEDYAFFIQGLLDLYEADFNIRWIRSAVHLQARQDELFWDENGGAYFSSEAGDPLVPARMRDDYDGAEPAANSVSALNLLRLARMLHDGAAEARALRVLSAHGMQMLRAPTAVPQMLVALGFAVRPPSQVVVVGPRDDASALLSALHRAFRPHAVTLLVHDGESRSLFSKNAPPIAEMQPLDGRPALYLCENFTCRPPVTTWSPQAQG